MNNKYKILVLMFLSVLFFSCNDEKDKHYDRSGSLPDQNLYELISQDESLSGFTRLIQIAGYDTLLASTQAFTVWAPLNEGLTGININTITKDEAVRIVSNHVARFNNSTATAPDKMIEMRSVKVYNFSEGGTVFGGSELNSKDILAKNGILHTIKEQIPYRYNIYEYIKLDENYSLLADFISSFDEKIFDEYLSIPIDIDENGQTVYDTVSTSYNRLLEHYEVGLGSINVEDSIYTMILPDNEAWNAAYERISPYFKVYNTDKQYADSVKKMQTSLAIVQDLVYRGRLENPAAYDSIFSTTGSVIHNPADLFVGTNRQTASNGYIYQTSNLRYDNTETWNKDIIVEAEYSLGRVVGASTSVYTRYIEKNDSIFISEDEYLEVQPTSTSAQPSVTFDIPNVLSGKYNIYVEFVPASIEGNPRDSTKVAFVLNYRNANGGNTPVQVATAKLRTSGTEKVKMQVFSGFEFPTSNFYDRLWYVDLLEGFHSLEDRVYTTRLLVRTNVSSTEFNNNIYTRRFRIDRIIFESVPN